MLKIVNFILISLLIISMLTVCAYAYSVKNVYGYAFSTIGIKNNLSSTYSGIFQNSLSDWNNKITKRRVVINSSTASSIIDLDYTNATDINSNLDFLQEVSNNADATTRAWSYNTTTCCSNHQTTMFIIYLNTHLLNNKNTNYKRGVISHELGHVLGLGDFNNILFYKDHIMNYSNPLTSNYVPASAEGTAVNNYWNH